MKRRTLIVLNLDEEWDSADLREKLIAYEWPDAFVVTVFTDPVAYIEAIHAV